MKKKNTGLIIVNIILVIFLTIAVSYIVYERFWLTPKSEEKIESEEEVREEDEKTENVDINSPLVQNLFTIFNLANMPCDVGEEELNTSNVAKLRVAYNNLPKNIVTDIECSKVGSIEGAFCGKSMTSLMMEAYTAGDMEKFQEYEKANHTDSIDASIIKNKVYELFGSNYNFQNESFGIGHVAEASCYLMHYDEKNNVYAEYSCEGGGTCMNRKEEVVSSSKTGDKLLIVTKLTNDNDEAKKETYEFKKDEENGNYFFVKVLKE